jgi:excisionase family DNA binding protein
LADYLKIPEVARRLDVSEPTVRRMVKGGKLPSVFIGGAYRVSEKDLEEYLESAKVTPGKAAAPLSQGTLFNGPMSAELPGLQTVRERRGMSVNELAARAGLTSSEIAALERGEQLPSPIRVKPLADILGCMPGELMYPHDQYEELLKEAEHPEVIEEDLSRLGPETALAIRRAHERLHERLVEAYRENDEQRAREHPEAG